MRGKPKLIKLQDKTGKLKSPNWYIEWWDVASGRNKRQATGCGIGTQDTEAQTFFHTWCLERDRPVAKDPSQMLVAQALQDYWDEHGKHGPNPERGTNIEKRIKPFFSNLYVSHLIPAKINEYIRKRREENYSDGTIRIDLSHLAAAINHEVSNRRILYAPKIKLPAPPAPRERVLSEDEVLRILANCKSDHVRNSILIMFNTGQRPGAIANLTWFQIDFKKGVIHFEKSGKRQTNKRARPVTMNQEVHDLLTEMYANRQGTGYVVEYVIKNKKGEVVKARPAGCIKKAFSRACDAAGVKDASRYTLRHTFANMITADDKTRSDIMGHTNTRTTNHHYLKTNGAKQKEALDNLPKLRKNYANAGNLPNTIPAQHGSV